DVDDVLMFTARSLDEPFRGRFRQPDGTTIILESNYAEVIWWTEFDDENEDGEFSSDENLKLHRRVLLVRPDLELVGNDIQQFLQENDISVRREANGVRVIANSLSDLTDRANRFARDGTVFVNNLNQPNASSQYVLQNLSQGEDILLTSLAAFDVQVFDPKVEVRYDPAEISANPTALLPYDPGYALGLASARVGGYVDLGIAQQPGLNINSGIFTPWPNSALPGRVAGSPPWQNATYGTWSSQYESDGLDQDGDGLIDEGIDRIDNDDANGPDDVNEYETRPPYPYPLRGIRVTLRLVEPTNQVVRQTSVIHNFVPE
ncbi:MAG: hypothetical protein VX438_01785, partial [Planctomycetota bacterium]|nr:hypothetical protein [Planctomycetota bacterium]